MNAKLIFISIFLIGSCVAQVDQDLINEIFIIHQSKTVEATVLTESIFTTTENPVTTVTEQPDNSSYQPCGTVPGMACVRQELCNNGNIGINLRFNFPIRDSIDSCNNPLETCCDSNDMVRKL